MGRLIVDKYKEWEAECNERFNTLKANEEELNRIFIDIYGLQDELTPEVEDKDVTVRKADLQAKVKKYLEEHGQTMAELVEMVLQGELYPKIQTSEKKRWKI